MIVFPKSFSSLRQPSPGVTMPLQLLGPSPQHSVWHNLMADVYCADLCTSSHVSLSRGLCRALFAPCTVCGHIGIFKNRLCPVSRHYDGNLPDSARPVTGGSRIWGRPGNTFSDLMSIQLWRPVRNSIWVSCHRRSLRTCLAYVWCEQSGKQICHFQLQLNIDATTTSKIQ